MRTLNELIQEAEERFEKEFDKVMKGCGVGYGKNQLWAKNFLKSSLKEAIKQAFEATRLEEISKTNARALSMEWLVTGFNEAVEQKTLLEKQFLGEE